MTVSVVFAICILIKYFIPHKKGTCAEGYLLRILETKLLLSKKAVGNGSALDIYGAS